MAVAFTNTKRAGDLCVLTVSITDNSSGGEATTDENVVGFIKQVAVNNPSAVSSAFSFTLEDTSTETVLFTKTVDINDLSPDEVNSGAGFFCRGPLKATCGATAVDRTLEIYYTKL